MKLPELLDKLDAAGFYRFVDPGRIAAFKKESCARGTIFHPDEGRLLGTSGETIFYGGVKNLLGELSGTLRELGVNLALEVEYVTVTARHPTTGEVFEFLKRKGDAKGIPPAQAGPGAIAVTQDYVEDERYTVTLNGAT